MVSLDAGSGREKRSFSEVQSDLSFGRRRRTNRVRVRGAGRCGVVRASFCGFGVHGESDEKCLTRSSLRRILFHSLSLAFRSSWREALSLGGPFLTVRMSATQYSRYYGRFVYRVIWKR